jgi:hypothetical protein
MLHRELIHFARLSPNDISRAAINAWCLGKSQPSRRKAFHFLQRYLKWLTEREGFSSASSARFKDIKDFLDQATGPDGPASASNSSSLSSYFSITNLTSSLERHRESRRQLNDFFYCSRRATSIHTSDESYYAMYRYSTTGDIAKSFVVSEWPDERQGLLFKSFSEGKPTAFSNHARITNGLVIPSSGFYQFIGHSCRSDKFISSESDEELNRPTLALEIMAFEYEAITRDGGLFPGIIMSMGHSNQPIVTRIAMLHIGTKDSLGVKISDLDVHPLELAASDFTDDLVQMIKRIEKLSPQKFAPRLHDAIGRQDWLTAGCQRMTNYILEMLDNSTPSGKFINSDGEQSHPGHRALEPFSPYFGRPRP